jgi:hypothetical protein
VQQQIEGERGLPPAEGGLGEHQVGGAAHGKEFRHTLEQTKKDLVPHQDAASFWRIFAMSREMKARLWA